MNFQVKFSVEYFDETNHYIIKYPDGSCDIMSLEEVKKNFEIPMSGGDGQHSDYESALAYLIEEEHDQVPGDFFSKQSVTTSHGVVKTKRQFSSDDSSLL